MPRGPYELSEPYPSWDEALANSTDWHHPSIALRALASARLVRDGKCTVEQDGRTAVDVSYSGALLAALLLGAVRHDSFQVIDFGGGLGSNFFQHRQLLPHLAARLKHWHIVERPIIVRHGHAEFALPGLSFHEQVPHLDGPTVTMFTGSFQYLREPFAVLDQIKSDILAIDRVVMVDPTLDLGRDEIHVQTPSPTLYYGANFPVWRFSYRPLIERMAQRGFKLVEDFPTASEYHSSLTHAMLFART